MKNDQCTLYTVHVAPTNSKPELHVHVHVYSSALRFVHVKCLINL